MIYFEIIKKLPFGQSNGYSGVFDSEEQGREFFKTKLSQGYEIKIVKPVKNDYVVMSKTDLYKLIENHKKPFGSDYAELCQIYNSK